MSKYKVGDKVRFLKDYPYAFGEWINYVDGDKVYEVVSVDPLGINNSYGLNCEYGFIFKEEWLVPAEEPTLKIKVSEGKIKNVIFNAPATIVFWTDGTKTVVKCGRGDKWDPEKGLAMACAKKLLGNEEGYHKSLEKHLPKNGGIESMDTEEIRDAVWAGCGLFTGIDCNYRCPCRYINDGDGTCCAITWGSRDQLIKMLKSFEKAGFFSYEDWRMHHAS
jgi:hypothetical protein